MIKDMEVRVTYRVKYREAIHTMNGPNYKYSKRYDEILVSGRGFTMGKVVYLDVDKFTSKNLRQLGLNACSTHTDFDTYEFREAEVRYLSGLEMLALNVI